MAKEKKEYIVSLRVSFITPLDANATNEREATAKVKAEFNKIFDKFKKKLNDIAEVEIDVDYVEECV